jgi:hypothetical protein
MKKIKLKALYLGAREILSREQLRNITGGACYETDCPVGYICNTEDACVLESGAGSEHRLIQGTILSSQLQHDC